MSDPNADLLRRVQRLEAIHEIERLKYRYWRACDHKDPDAFRECFIKHGADIDYGVVGKFNDREPLVEVFTQVALAKEGASWLVHDVHHGKHPSIEVIDEQTEKDRKRSGAGKGGSGRVDMGGRRVIRKKKK